MDEVVAFLKERGHFGNCAANAAPAEVGPTEGLPSVDISQEAAETAMCIADGWATPLKCFMTEQQLLSTLHLNCVTDGAQKFAMTCPMICPIASKEGIEGAKAVLLKYDNKPIAVVHDAQVYANRKEEVCARVFGTFSKNHPFGDRLLQTGDFLLTGSAITKLANIDYNDGLDEYRLTPSEIKKRAAKLETDALFGFQLRNPLHNGHVLLINDTFAQLRARGFKNPTLLLHPIGGWVKDDDVPLYPRMKQHEAVINDGLFDGNVILAIWPSPMFYGGPTEVVWHATSRVNAGCKFFIVGRDPAGIKHPENAEKDLYDPFHGQKLLQLVMTESNVVNKLTILPFKVAAYNNVEKKMTFFNPAKKEEFDFISGSRMRQLARDGQEPPEGFMSPTGWKILAEYYASLKN